VGGVSHRTAYELAAKPTSMARVATSTRVRTIRVRVITWTIDSIDGDPRAVVPEKV
jgi:hypothetical protein